MEAVGSELQLKVHVPRAWEYLGASNFPDRSLPTMTIGISVNNGTNADALGAQLSLALEYASQLGERIGSHGFAIMYRADALRSVYTHGIAIGVVDPFPFYYANDKSVDLGSRPGLAGFLRSHRADLTDSNEFASAGYISSEISKYLKPLGNVMLEHFVDYAAFREDQVSNCVPLRVESWGLIADKCREQVLHPGAARALQGDRTGMMRDWRSPYVSVPILDNLVNRKLFPSGIVRPSDALRLGAILGTSVGLREYYSIVNDNAKSLLKCLSAWNDIDVIFAQREIEFVATGVEGIARLESALPIPLGVELRWTDEAMEQYVKWLHDEFLQRQEPQGQWFGLGLMFWSLIEPAVAATVQQSGDQSRNLAGHLRKMMTAAIRADREMMAGRIPPLSRPALIRVLRQLGYTGRYSAKRATIAIESATDLTLVDTIREIVRLHDRTFEPVFYRTKGFVAIAVDWDELEERLEQLRRQGIEHPCLIRSADGNLDVGPYPFPIYVMAEAVPPEQVVYCDLSALVPHASIVTWKDLRAGRYFPLKNATAGQDP
jgi:hypothetical protein